MKRFFKNKIGQVWIETVIYTVIGLTIIGLVLTFAKPAIDNKKDEIVIEQSLESLSNINQKITEVKQAIGNRRVVDLKLGKGDLIINATNDSISWITRSRAAYSEENVKIDVGDIEVTTLPTGPYSVVLKINPSSDIRVNDGPDGEKILNPSTTSYRLTIENIGKDTTNGKTIISIRQS